MRSSRLILVLLAIWLLPITSGCVSRGHSGPGGGLSHAGGDGGIGGGMPRALSYRPDALSVGTEGLPPPPVPTAATQTIVVGPDPAGIAVPPPARHVVARGETLFAIARQYLGDGGRWQEIVAVNPGLDPGRLPVGRAIVIPQ